jgi:hypothetical protein
MAATHHLPLAAASRAVPVARTDPRWPRILRTYAGFHRTWFALYAFLGKGFAYGGIPPFFAGELLFLLAVPTLFATRKLGALLRQPLGVLATLFLVWQVLCTAPYVEIYGLDALRDCVIWAYLVFGFVTAALVLRLPLALDAIISSYRRFSKMYLFFGPAAWLATLYLREWLPVWPGTAVTVPMIKADEFCAHLAGILAFTLVGLGRSGPGWVLLMVGDAVLVTSGRGGLVAFLMAAAVATLLWPRWKWLFLVTLTGLILLLTAVTFDRRLALPGTPREFSLDQVSSGLLSVVGDSDRNDLQGTKSWRLAWWRKIWDYTVDGDFFWMGKGYGVNLADSDGFQVSNREDSLRSPHNSHLTFLARSGVPGFLLWVALQLTWATMMIRGYLRARRQKLVTWSGLFTWLFAYWVAFMVAAGSDVFLEGPMAGIPFWTIFGVGWGASLHFNSGSNKCLKDCE